MPPRTQAALLEAMEERQITIDGVRHPLDSYFTVFATQNPVEFEGTYPLPEAQLDRFLLKVVVPYPEEADEIRMLQMFERGPASVSDADMRIEAIPTETLAEARREVTQVIVETTVMRYIGSIARSTRTAPQISLGASPRAALSLLYVSKAMAAMNERNYVIPDDVKQAVLPVFRHRIMLRPDAQLEGLSPDQVLTDIVRSVAVPK
jgi:MoxR-like ATPase